MSIPTLLLVIVFVAAVGPSLFSVVSVIGLLGWPGACRLVRGQMLELREVGIHLAARVVGVSYAPDPFRHLIPNIMSSLAVLATFGVASAIILEAGLSFLGLGVKVPSPQLGRDDQRGAIADGAHRHAVAVDRARASRSRSPCCRSISSATASAMPSTHARSAAAEPDPGDGR